MSLLITVPPNLVQSIRAFRVVELREEAVRLGQHFLYAHCADALTKQQVCGRIGESFHFPKPCSKNVDALRECLTNTINAAGPQPGFIVVLEQLPNTQKFDKEARETLLDVFRDAAEILEFGCLHQRQGGQAEYGHQQFGLHVHLEPHLG